MSILSFLLVLVLEQVAGMRQRHWLEKAYAHLLDWVQRKLDVETRPRWAWHQAWLLWCVAVLPLTWLAFVIYSILHTVWGAVLAWAWMTLVFFLCLGFQSFTGYFAAVRTAWEEGDADALRSLLHKAMGCTMPDANPMLAHELSRLPEGQLLPLSLKISIFMVHRRFFGVLAMFFALALLGLGPAGAVLFRLTELAYARWVESAPALAPLTRPSIALQQVSAQAWRIVNWAPARATGLAFAIAGNFEAAHQAWRRMQDAAPSQPDAAFLAVAMGTLDTPLREVDRTSMGGLGCQTTWEPEVGAMAGSLMFNRMANLIWRMLLIWLGGALLAGMIALVT